MTSVRGMVAAVAVLAGLTGCTLPRPVPTPPPPIYAPPVAPSPPVTAPPRKPADPPVVRCPSVADIRRLRAARPKPLRLQPMPASPAERVARTAAQLGQYEARDAWADQVEDAFRRCDPD